MSTAIVQRWVELPSAAKARQETYKRIRLRQAFEQDLRALTLKDALYKIMWYNCLLDMSRPSPVRICIVRCIEAYEAESVGVHRWR